MKSETIEKFLDAEKAKDIDVKVETQGLLANLRERFMNDSSFIDPIKKSVRGELLSSKENKLMKLFDVSKEEYDALPESTKFDSLMDLCKTKSGKSSGDVNKELEALNKKMATLKAENETLSQTIPAEKTKLEAEKENWITSNQLGKLVGKHELIVPLEFAETTTVNMLLSKYDVKRVDGKLKLLQKGTELDAYDDKNTKIEADTAIKSILEENKLIKKSNANPDPNNPPPPTPPANTSKLPGLQKAQAHAEKIKAAE